MVEHIQLDITTVTQGIVAHQVNCMGAMGAGVAKQIRAKWPVVYSQYLNHLASFNGRPWLALGTAQEVEITTHLAVANLFAQYDYGRDYRRTEYGSLLSCIMQVRRLASWRNAVDIYFPYQMGCVNAGGDWHIVQDIINEQFSGTEYHLFICHEKTN